MEAIRVRYNRRISQKLGDDFDTTEIGGEWEFQQTTFDSFEDDYRKAYYMVSKTIDRLIDGVPHESVTKREEYKDKPPARVVSSEDHEAYEATGERSQTEPDGEFRLFERGEGVEDIIEKQPVHIPRARVWDIKPGKASTGAPYVAVRVGNLDHVPTRNGYARVKSYDGAMIRKLEALELNSYVDLWGYYESWQGREETQWDFIPQRIERA